MVSKGERHGVSAPISNFPFLIPGDNWTYTSKHWLLPHGTLWVVSCMPCLYLSTGTQSVTLIHAHTDAKHSSMLLRGPLNKTVLTDVKLRICT